MNWRWDQGRLLYFQFDNLKKISNVISELSGSEMSSISDILRSNLVKETELPFAPSNYTVWRNYKRVFECSFLATKVNGNLYATDFCLALSSSAGNMKDIDDYFALYIPRFRFPFPAFQEYDDNEMIVHPFCAILKYLAAKSLRGESACISLDEVFTIIIANKCTGYEDISFYNSLNPIFEIISNDQRRQVREMLIFISQMSILKWFNNSLFLDIDNEDIESPEFKKLITPLLVLPSKSKEEDFLKITKINDEIIVPNKIRSREDSSDEIFIEGNRSRVTHLKIERSPLLRKIFLDSNPIPRCHMCEVNMSHRYPWAKYLIEIHHVLPLSSSLAITSKGTSIDDLVGLCPSCHKGVHLYYKKWLDSQMKVDFIDKNEAKDVYLQAKGRLVL